MTLKAIAFQDNITARENLPYPIVHYPGHYGAFLGFKKDEHSSIVFCSCAKEAIENYIKLRLSYGIPCYSDPLKQYTLSKMYFPYEVVRDLVYSKVPGNLSVLNHLRFEHKLCHECNKATPIYRYCHEMYGGVFTQTYGWYINKQSFEYGIDPIQFQYLKELVPQEILELLEEKKPLDEKAFQLNRDNKWEESYEIQKVSAKLTRKINNLIQDEVRLKLGHKKVGEAWTSETILYYIVKKLYPSLTVKRHYRPDCLERLELDIYIEELKLGIEYQGIQHFKPIKHWGGESALTVTQERDKKKKLLCDQNNIKLVYFYYHENLSEEIVVNKINAI